uniref:Negative regulator of flagellin synthesis n=1 Tax=Panagrellus redivivus TaxID=6233 RepID=A0A7E4VY49_PANRE
MGCRLSRTISQPDLASPSSPDGRSGNGGQRKNKDSGGMLGSGAGKGSSAGGESPSRGRLTNGQSVLHRRDTPANNLLENILNSRNGNTNNTNANGGGTGGTYLTGANGAGAGNDPLLPAKPIGQVESASQADFFRMLDEKIAQGPGDLAESPNYDD